MIQVIIDSFVSTLNFAKEYPLITIPMLCTAMLCVSWDQLKYYLSEQMAVKKDE